MADHPLAAALTNATYEFLGAKHRPLLDAARRESPRARGATLATTVLGLLEPELARAARHEGEAFFSRWLSQHGGEGPRVRSGWMTPKEETMEAEDLRWVGLAVFIVLASGALLRLTQKRSDDGPREPRPLPVAVPKPQAVQFAVAAFSGKVRDVGATAATAGDLLTLAAFWWVGSADSWDGIVRTAGLSEASSVPDTDDALLVALYEAPGTSAGTPSSRPEGATRLREAARAGELRMLGMFAISDPACLSAAGFRR